MTGLSLKDKYMCIIIMLSLCPFNSFYMYCQLNPFLIIILILQILKRILAKVENKTLFIQIGNEDFGEGKINVTKAVVLNGGYM